MAQKASGGNTLQQVATLCEGRVNWKPGKQGFMARCPCHEDKTPSLSVDQKDGKILVHCFAGCDRVDVEKALGISRETERLKGDGRWPDYNGREARLVSRYTDAKGVDSLTVKRFEPPLPSDAHQGRTKSIRRTPRAKGQWHLLRYKDVLSAIEAGKEIILVEGEKKCGRLVTLGYAATTWAGGAKGIGTAIWDDLNGARVVLWPDNDKGGQTAMTKVAGEIKNAAFRRVAIPEGKPKGWDCGDATADECKRLIEDAKPYSRPHREARKGAASEEMKIGPCIEAARTALQRFGIEIRDNLRAGAAEYRKKGGDWEPFNDKHLAAWKHRTQASFHTFTERGEFRRLKIGRDDWRDAINSLRHDREVDPFLEWLQALPAWDGQERLDHWLGEVFAVDTDVDTNLVRWASRATVMGAIKRARQPGTKLDEMPVLIGDQGIGKSTATAHLLPAEHRSKWFSDALDLAGNKKERLESTLGRVICECSEMTGSGRAELESLKSFLTGVDDNSIRLAYAERPESMPRRFVLIGTADRDALPNDPAGNRRFVAIPIASGPGGPGGLREYLNRHRNQLWAEGLARVVQGEHPRLPDSLKAAQRSVNERHRQADEVLEDAVAQVLAEAMEADDWATDGVQLSVLMNCLPGEPLDRANPAHGRRLASILKNMGWKKGSKRIDGLPRPVWRKGVAP